MFDNGNFRRKRKRKSDIGEGSSEGALISGESGDASSPKNASADVSASSEKALSPPTVGHSPCLSNFLTEMSGVVSGPLDVGADPMNRPLSHNLPSDGSQRMAQSSGFTSYSPSSSVPEWISPLPPPPPLSPSGSHSSLGYNSPAINQFNGHFYTGLTSTGILFPREGTEV